MSRSGRLFLFYLISSIFGLTLCTSVTYAATPITPLVADTTPFLKMKPSHDGTLSAVQSAALLKEYNKNTPHSS